MHIDFDVLECRSAFDIAGAESIRPTSLGFGDEQGIRLVMLRDILYLPSVLEYGQSICLAEQRLIPCESVLDCSSVQFLRESRQKTRNDQRQYSDPFEVITSEESVCILGNMFSRNFGHWSEELLKVALLERMLPGSRYAFANMPAFALDSLRFLGIEAKRIISVAGPTLFSRCIFTTAVLTRTWPTIPPPYSYFEISFTRNSAKSRGLAPGDCGQREDKCFAMVGLRITRRMSIDALPTIPSRLSIWRHCLSSSSSEWSAMPPSLPGHTEHSLYTLSSCRLHQPSLNAFHQCTSTPRSCKSAEC